MKIFLMLLALLMANVSYGGETVLVFFHADWCNPCHELSAKFKDPWVDKALKDGKIRVSNVDYDARLDLAEGYEIKSLPTVIFVDYDKDTNTTKELSRFVGSRTRDELYHIIRGIKK